METGEAGGDDEVDVRAEEADRSEGSASEDKDSVNAPSCVVKEEGSADDTRPGKNGGGWPWGRQRRNLRLPITGCPVGRVHTAERREAGDAEEVADGLEACAGQHKESKQNDEMEIDRQNCGKTRSRADETQGYSFVTEDSAARLAERSREGSKGDRQVAPRGLLASRVAAAMVSKRSSGPHISHLKPKKGRATHTSLVGGSSACRSGQDNKVQIHTAFSITSLNKVCSTFNKEKRSIVESIGLGELLCLPDLKMFPRQMVLWLLSKMDSSNGTLKMTNGDEIPFSDKDVEIVLGIPCKGINVLAVESCSLTPSRRKSSVLMLRTGEEPNFKTIESILLTEVGRMMTIKEKDAFKVAFVLYADAVFLGPKGQHPKINTELLKKCSDPSVVGELNWCDYVVRGLKHSARKVQFTLLNGNKNPTIEGCLLFLLVFYLDNLDFGLLNTDHQLRPRYKDFGPEIVKELVTHDKIENITTGSAVFGRTKIRRKDEVVYLRERTGRHMFSGTVKDQNECVTNLTLSVVIDKINSWLASVKDLTDDTENDLLKYFTSCKIKHDNDDKGFLPNSRGRIHLHRNLHGNKSRGTKNKSSRGMTPLMFKEDEIIVLDTPESRVRSNSFERSSHEVNENIGLAGGDDDDSNNSSTAGLTGSNDDELETDLQGSGYEESDDDSLSPDICGNRQFAYETSTVMDEIIGSSAVCTLALGDGFKKSREYPTSPVVCASHNIDDQNLLVIKEALNSTVGARLEAEDDIDEFNGHGSALHEGDAHYQHGPAICVAYEGGEYSNIDSQHESERDKRGEIEVKQTEPSVGLILARVDNEIKQDKRRELEIKQTEPYVGLLVPRVEGLLLLEEHNDNMAEPRVVGDGGLESNINVVEPCQRKERDMWTKSNFGILPFAVDLTHRDAPFACVTNLYKALMNLTKEDKERSWFIHKRPYELCIKGWSLHLMFASISDFSKDVINAIVRLFLSLDDELYASSSERRFRHFLPPDFAERIMASRDFDDPKRLSEMFNGHHITYYVGDCKLIILPVLVGLEWALYVCNFDWKTITVIDPVKMVGASGVVMRKHKEMLGKLHKAMILCKQQLFTLPIVDMKDWEEEFLTIEGEDVDSSSSGFYTMFYGRYFDGKTLTRILTKESQRIHKCNILYQLLALKNNNGDLPAKIREAIPPVKW